MNISTPHSLPRNKYQCIWDDKCVCVTMTHTGALVATVGTNKKKLHLFFSFSACSFVEHKLKRILGVQNKGNRNNQIVT